MLASKEMTARDTVVIGGEKPLGVPGGHAPLHAPLTLAGRLMRVVRTVVQVSVLPVLDAREPLPLRSPIAGELIRDAQVQGVVAIREDFCACRVQAYVVTAT